MASTSGALVMSAQYTARSKTPSSQELINVRDGANVKNEVQFHPSCYLASPLSIATAGKSDMLSLKEILIRCSGAPNS
jgi:hypothetical protein